MSGVSAGVPRASCGDGCAVCALFCVCSIRAFICAVVNQNRLLLCSDQTYFITEIRLWHFAAAFFVSLYAVFRRRKHISLHGQMKTTLQVRFLRESHLG